MYEFIPQIIGLLAVATFLLSYQQKKRRDIIVLNVISRCLYILQYLLLGAIAGAVLDVLGAISSMIASKKDSAFVKKHTRLIFILVNVTIIGAGLTVCIVKRSIIDVLPILGVLFHTCAFWLSDERVIRRVSLAGSPFWLVYNFISRAYGSAIGDVLTIVSILSAMFKYRKKNKNQESEEEKNV
jgi:hypothetical protein